MIHELARQATGDLRITPGTGENGSNDLEGTALRCHREKITGVGHVGRGHAEPATSVPGSQLAKLVKDALLVRQLQVDGPVELLREVPQLGFGHGLRRPHGDAASELRQVQDVLLDEEPELLQGQHATGELTKERMSVQARPDPIALAAEAHRQRLLPRGG